MKLYNFNKNKLYQHCIYKHPFRIFYNLNGDDKTPSRLEFNLHADIPDYILKLMNSFYEAYNIYTNRYNLKSPLKEGIYYDKGASFIDVLIVNIPVQKGLVAAELIDNSEYFIGQDNMYGDAIKIQLDKNLVDNTATPIHELFHVFQYNYCNFNNMWFMEGLARYSQNITHKRKMIDEELPQNLYELEYLLSRKHDAEYFFRKLISLCDNDIRFLKLLLENCTIQEKHLCQKNSIKKWTKELKKTDINNEYILQAIADTLNKLQENQDDKLQKFIKFIENYKVGKNNMQKSTTTLIIHNQQQLDLLHDIEEIDGDLIIEASDIKLLDGLNNLKKLNSMIIKDNKNLLKILGFNALESVNNIEISNNKNLKEIKGFKNLFKNNYLVDGYIKIIKNSNLKDVSFLKGIRVVDSSFYLHQNSLVNLKGLEFLEKVNASFSLSNNKLVDISALSNLKYINGILSLAHNKLSTLYGLENLQRLKVTKWNGEYRTLNIHENKDLIDISALKNIQSSTGNIIAYIDVNNNYSDKPDINSKFSKNNFDVYDASNHLPLSKNYLINSTINKNYNILCGKGWEYALKKSTWLKAHHISFKDIDKVIEYSKNHNIEILFANNYSSQLAIFNNQDRLKSLGLKFIVNSKQTLENLVDKQLFYEIMLMHNFAKYVPIYYEHINEVKYPCMVKIKSGGAGRNMFIAHSEDELNNLKNNMIMSEYLPSNTEYATSIFLKNGKILKHMTFSKTSKNDVYILQHEKKEDIEIKKCDTPFLELFEKIIQVMSGKDIYCQCSINFKIEDGIPKIFEINPRIGYTLSRFPDDFKEMMDSYLYEIGV